MTESIIFSINVVLPLFMCSLVGYAARRIGLVDGAFLAGCTQVVFYIAIPCNIFLSIAGSDLGETLNMRLLGYVLAAIFLISVVLTILNTAVVKNRKIAATMVLCMFRSNFAMLGIPLAISLMGADGAVPTMVIVPFATFLYTVLSVGILVLTLNGRQENLGKTLLNVVAETVKNPLIIASLASILVSAAHLSLPAFVNGTIEKFGDMTTGLALFMLGAQMDIHEVTGRLRYTVPIMLVRLMVIPIVVVALAVALGFRGGDLACVFIVFSAPTAVNSYILAEKMGGDKGLAADAVLLTSCMAMVTLTIGIFVLRFFGLI